MLKSLIKIKALELLKGICISLFLITKRTLKFILKCLIYTVLLALGLVVLFYFSNYKVFKILIILLILYFIFYIAYLLKMILLISRNFPGLTSVVPNFDGETDDSVPVYTKTLDYDKYLGWPYFKYYPYFFKKKLVEMANITDNKAALIFIQLYTIKAIYNLFLLLFIVQTYIIYP